MPSLSIAMFPNTPNKHDKTAVFTAADRLAQRRQNGTAPTFTPPDLLVLCHQDSLLRYAVKSQRGKKMGAFFGDFYLLRKTKGRVGIVGNFGVGAPVTAVLVEDFAALGVKNFLSLGIAGGLQPHLRAGDLVLVDKAIRDEGTSHHYLPHNKYVRTPGQLTTALQHTLAQQQIPFHNGPSWTTDAPYRETLLEINQFQKEGILTVEMETAALFATATYLGLQATTALVVADSLKNGRWQLTYNPKTVQKSLETAFDLAIQVGYKDTDREER